MTLQGSNGGGGDGLALSGTTLSDSNQNTVVAWFADTAPPTTGNRSAYGSVLLSGTFSQLLINVSNNLIGGDGGSFTISTVPEPATFALVTAGLLGLAVLRRQSR